MVEEREYSNNEEQLVVFKLGREEYGVSILNVQEIKRITEITRVPYTPEFIKGVMNLRGSVLPVIDTKKRLGIENEEYTDDTRIIASLRTIKYALRFNTKIILLSHLGKIKTEDDKKKLENEKEASVVRSRKMK